MASEGQPCEVPTQGPRDGRVGGQRAVCWLLSALLPPPQATPPTHPDPPPTSTCCASWPRTGDPAPLASSQTLPAAPSASGSSPGLCCSWISHACLTPAGAAAPFSALCPAAGGCGAAREVFVD